MKINFPNILTVTRILLTPLFVIFLLRGMFGFALVVFTVSAVSDALDGLIARYFDQRTELGAYLDPLADKLLMTTSYVSLAILHLIPSWLTVIVISRDVIIALGFAMFAITHKQVEVKPSRIGKCNTAAQLLTIILLLLSLYVPQIAGMMTFCYGITAFLTTASGLHYLYVGMNVLQGNNEKGRPEDAGQG